MPLGAVKATTQNVPGQIYVTAPEALKSWKQWSPVRFTHYPDEIPPDMFVTVAQQEKQYKAQHPNWTPKEIAGLNLHEVDAPQRGFSISVHRPLANEANRGVKIAYVGGTPFWHSGWSGAASQFVSNIRKCRNVQAEQDRTSKEPV